MLVAPGCERVVGPEPVDPTVEPGLAPVVDTCLVHEILALSQERRDELVAMPERRAAEALWFAPPRSFGPGCNAWYEGSPLGRYLASAGVKDGDTRKLVFAVATVRRLKHEPIDLERLIEEVPPVRPPRQSKSR